jgi:hypothetical protein
VQDQISETKVGRIWVPPKQDQVGGQAERIWVRPKEAVRIGGFGMTRCYELINSGQLETRKVGGLRLVSVASIKALGSDEAAA